MRNPANSITRTSKEWGKNRKAEAEGRGSNAAASRQHIAEQLAEMAEG